MPRNKPQICLNCNNEFRHRKGHGLGKYCSNVCQQEYGYKTITLLRFNAGEIEDRRTLRKILSKEIKDVCFECGIKEWNGKELSLQVDHINGDASNNNPDNLRLLCPNCHSQTDTYVAKNKGNGRGSKGLKR